MWLASLKICSQSTVPQAKRSGKHTGEYLVLTVDVFVSLQMSSRSRIRVMNHSWRSSIIFGACTFLFSSWINGKSSQPFCLCLCLPKRQQSVRRTRVFRRMFWGKGWCTCNGVKTTHISKKDEADSNLSVRELKTFLNEIWLG